MTDPEGQLMHAVVETALYRPATQRVHAEAPTFVNVLVKPPGSHEWQSETWSLPVLSTYRLAGHPMQVTVEFGLYHPRAQLVHDTAPSPANVSVIDPGLQRRQSTFESAEYCPAEHWVHDVAPATSRVSVTDPEGQVAQATVETALYRPALHRVQE